MLNLNTCSGRNPRGGVGKIVLVVVLVPERQGAIDRGLGRKMTCKNFCASCAELTTTESGPFKRLAESGRSHAAHHPGRKQIRLHRVIRRGREPCRDHRTALEGPARPGSGVRRSRWWPRSTTGPINDTETRPMNQPGVSEVAFREFPIVVSNFPLPIFDF